MRLPPFLMAGVLLLWGWQVDLFYCGLLMAAILEGARWLDARWDFSDVDLGRIWSLCTLLFLGATVASFVSNDGTTGLMGLLEAGGVQRTESLNATTRSALVLLQWIPMLFFPMILAQVYGRKERMDARVFSWLIRKRHARNPGLPVPPSFNISYPYFVICMVSTSTVNVNRGWFFPALLALVAWALWGERNRRYPAAVWVLTLLMVASVGYGGQLGLRQLQQIVQRMDSFWLSRLGAKSLDRSSTVTDLGAVGRVKSSGAIVLRVTPETRPVPELLREVSYNEFQSPGRWYAAQKPFVDFGSESDKTSWTLMPEKPGKRSVVVSRSMRGGGKGLLAVPNGTGRLEELGVFIMVTNAMGVLKVNDGPGVISYRARFEEGRTIDSPPEAADLLVPETELEAVREAAREVHLDGLAPVRVLRVLRGWFEEQFEYSIFLEGQSGSHATPLAEFLLGRRKGHCEYFASAAVFLLRQARIPARYAVGYSVQERRGDAYVARGRHAHAWCLAYVDGAWVDFDPTPPSWNAVEAERAAFLEPIRDLFSDLWFEFSKWRWSDPGLRKYLPWLVVPPVVLLTVRLVSKRQWRRLRRPSHLGPTGVRWPGEDSDFYRVERVLLARGETRGRGEPLGVWIDRVSGDRQSGAVLAEILRLHYRCRFDPAGITVSDRSALRDRVEQWLSAETPGAGS